MLGGGRASRQLAVGTSSSRASPWVTFGKSLIGGGRLSNAPTASSNAQVLIPGFYEHVTLDGKRDSVVVIK